jgi:hypothetical protein
MAASTGAGRAAAAARWGRSVGPRRGAAGTTGLDIRDFSRDHGLPRGHLLRHELLPRAIAALAVELLVGLADPLEFLRVGLGFVLADQRAIGPLELLAVEILVESEKRQRIVGKMPPVARRAVCHFATVSSWTSGPQTARAGR